MQITKVEATNFKGRDFSYQLAPMNIIVGANFTGKTSIIDAIRLALMGYIPELGKTSGATWGLSSGTMMGVNVFLNDDKDGIALTAQESGGKIKITRFAPKDFSDVPLLNASAYFGMTERERYDYVFKAVPIDKSFTREAILQGLSGDVSDDNHVFDRVREILSGPASIQDQLDAAIVYLAGEFTRWNAKAKDTQGAIRTLADLKNRQKEMPGNVRELQAAEQKARHDSAKAYKRMLDLRTQQKEHASFVARRDRVAQQRKSYGDNSQNEKLERLIKESSGLLRKIVEPSLTETGLGKLTDELKDLLAGINAKKLALTRIKSDRKDLDIATECPYCKTKTARWKDNLERTFIHQEKELEAEIKRLESTAGELQSRVQAVNEEHDAANTILAFNKEINGKVAGWQKQIDDNIRQRGSWMKALEAEEEAVAKESVEPVSNDDIAAAQDANDQAVRATDDAQKKLKAAELLEHELQLAAKSQLDHEKADTTAKLVKALKSALENTKAAMVEHVFTDLLKVANSIVGKIIPTPLAFHDGEVGRWEGHRWIGHKTFTGAEQALTYVAIATALSQQSALKLLIFDELGRLDYKRKYLVAEVLVGAVKAGYIDQFILAGAVEPLTISDIVKDLGGTPKFNVIEL